MRNFLVVISLALGFTCIRETIAEPEDPFALYEIRDSALLAELWKTGNGPGDPAPGSYQVLIHNTVDGRKGYLLREGTETLELPEFALSLLQGSRSGRVDPEKAERPKDQEDNFFPGLWKRRDSLLTWLQWPTGLTVNCQNSFSQGTGAALEQERRLDFELSDRPYTWLHLEIGAHQSQFGGGLSQLLFDPKFTGAMPYWSGNQWWWHAGIGVPGVKWDLTLADRAFPDFFWLDSSNANAAKQRAQGRLLRQWSQGAALPGNLAQALHFKFNALRYSLYLDQDAYKAPVHEIMIEDLPMVFGAWGMGVTVSGPSIYTRAWVDLLPVTLAIPAPRNYHSLVHFTFVHFDFAYYDKQHFHLILATRMSLDNPALRWPGARS